MTIEENLKFREDFIKKEFKKCLGYELNLENPKTFNEKIQWLKLYQYSDLITSLQDKYSSRKYISEKIGDEYLIPLLGVWDKPEDIDFNSLPNKFVLKISWGWAQNIIVEDKSKLDIQAVIKKLKKWIEPFSNIYYNMLEISYKYITPKIICEEFIEDDIRKNLTVYKIFCFSKNPHMIQVILDDKTEYETTNFYDLYWNKLNIKQIYNNFEHEIEKPFFLDKMIDLSKKIAVNFNSFIRVDFYESNGKLYFSECAFYPDSGMGKFEPSEWDYKLGSILQLPNEKNIDYDYIDKKMAIELLTNLEPLALKYKELERDSQYKEKYNKLKNNSFALLGFFNEDDYFTFIIFGLKIVFKKKKSKLDK